MLLLMSGQCYMQMSECCSAMRQQSHCPTLQSLNAAGENRKVVRLVVQHIMHSMSKHASTLRAPDKSWIQSPVPSVLRHKTNCVMLFTVYKAKTPRLATHLDSHALHLGFHSCQEGSPELVVVYALGKALQDSCPEPEATAAYVAAALSAHCLALHCRLGLRQHSTDLHIPI